MSQQLINHSPDLKLLRDEGYEVAVSSGYLIVRKVPYLNKNKEIKYGTIVSELTLSGDVTSQPSKHTVFFSGERPCDANGVELKIINADNNTKVDGITCNFSFSRKLIENGAKKDYKNYHEKITTYVEILLSPAKVIDPNVTAQNYTPIATDDTSSVFNYEDTATSRAGIGAINQKLAQRKVAIIGLGGTGSYVLDLIAKTPVGEIHLYDADEYLQHNAFRSPGAPSLDELRAKPKKVEYLMKLYSKMHKNIVARDCKIDHSNVNELKDMDFVFICIDGGSNKSIIFKKLDEFGVPFIDVGMGLYIVNENNSLAGVLRITTSSDNKRDHVNKHVSFNNNGNNEYASNIQTADLNSLNASLAVIKWKKTVGFYNDIEKEYSSTYTIDGNVIANGDRHE